LFNELSDLTIYALCFIGITAFFGITLLGMCLRPWLHKSPRRRIALQLALAIAVLTIVSGLMAHSITGDSIFLLSLFPGLITLAFCIAGLGVSA